MPTASTRARAKPAKAPPKRKRLSRVHRPEGLSLHEWQVGLRRQFGTEQEFEIENCGRQQVFSEFAVTNPATERTYRVVVRGDEPGVNFCSCPDYAVNTLGTCKHIEFTLHRLRNRHTAALRRGYQPPFAEVYVRYGLKRSVLFSPGENCPPRLTKLANGYFDAYGALTDRAFATFDGFMKKAAKLGHDLRVYDDAAALIAEVRDGRARRRRLQARFGGKGAAAAWRRLLKTPLYSYQQKGALFAATAGRAVIADEMGLGKTIEAIAAAEILARDAGTERVLIVCPASLKSQWHQEITKFSARPALIIEGLAHHRGRLYEDSEPFFKIVNYDVVHRDLGAIEKWGPDLVVLDEAQRIKNWQTRTAKSVKRIDSPFCIVLTGTPLENRLEELHSIIEFVDRHCLGPLFAFKAAHEVHEEESCRVVGYRDLKRIGKTLAPILIRRTKSEVLDQLPPRLDKNFFVPMTEQQWVPHRENQETVARLVAKWRRYKFLSEQDQLRMRIALQYMRMACDNTYLVDHQTKHGVKVDELAKLLEEIFEERGAKVVVFSQWLRMNELVEEMLDARRWGYVHLHGGVPSRERKNLTRALREDQNCRVFLSTDAGGVGLNLQAASTVINMDLPWNPAILEQRVGRIHRLGQKRPVRVVNFIAEGAIEHGMLSLLNFKRSMFAGVLDGATDKVFMGDSAMNRFIKTVESATSAVPSVVPTPTDAAEPVPTDEQLEGQRGDGRPAPSRADGLDARSLGELLTRGADWLNQLGRTLADPTAPSGRDAADGVRSLVTTDSSTGRSELRIPLPDQKTLQQWTGQFAEIAGTIKRVIETRG